MPSHALDQSMNGVYRVVILESSRPVGFFLLNQTERVYNYTENPSALLLTAFSINHMDHGKVFAERAMRMVKGFAEYEFPHVNEIVHTVNHNNIPAPKLYSKCGFLDTGLRREGRIGEQIVMSLSW
ncbi:GNAT family N-acetyltransferase [Halobacillus trueperi]|uniref:GNAT family N-acetyltransferase n=1 Tax=Halobacillus trueperi TaxID=156205 RepID=UPI0037368392